MTDEKENSKYCTTNGNASVCMLHLYRVSRKH